MPSRFHEIVISKVAREIGNQLESIAESGRPSAEFAQAVDHEGSSTINFPDDPRFGDHDPDACFVHSSATYPGVIIEVSFSQKRKDLEKLAYEYILGSDGSINVVVGLDVEYRGRNEGTLCVWRPRFIVGDDGEKVLTVEKTITDQVCPSPPSAFMSSYLSGILGAERSTKRRSRIRPTPPT